jgi:hypothetical protein
MPDAVLQASGFRPHLAKLQVVPTMSLVRGSTDSICAKELKSQRTVLIATV